MPKKGLSKVTTQIEGATHKQKAMQGTILVSYALRVRHKNRPLYFDLSFDLSFLVIKKFLVVEDDVFMQIPNILQEEYRFVQNHLLS